MSQKEIEVILTRQLASYLSLATFLVDPDGNLLHFNEAAEKILGRRFDEVGEISADELAQFFDTTDDRGEPLPLSELPILRALRERHPAHNRFRLRAFDGVERKVAATAVPLVGQGDRFLGAICFFWESEE